MTSESLAGAPPSLPSGVRTPPSGLTAQQVRQRVRERRTNAAGVRTSRSILDIARANILTPFNGLLGLLFVIIAVTGRWQNALFGLVVLANTLIGIVQELRAKRTLDRLAILSAPRARVIRDGVESEVPLEAVVADDLVALRAGDQVPADGEVYAAAGLEVDESLLTGESEPVAKEPGDQVRSGSIVVAGSGTFQATGVGPDAYATRLAREARRFTVTRSELVGATNTILRWVALTMVIVGPILLVSQFQSSDNHTWQDAVTGAVAALVGMVPEGLVLLTSLAFMVGALALARRQTLVQELPAVEVLARVDVVCLDKTGTLTMGEIGFDRVELLGSPAGDVEQALALLTSADTTATGTAIRTALPLSTWTATDTVPFSSARKWSAVATAGRVTWVLGAPEAVLPSPQAGAQRSARLTADRLAAEGSRVLLLARSDTPTARDGAGEPSLPAYLLPAALVVLNERIRDDAAATMRYFTEQGVALKVISGDSPRTVGAVAAAVGVPGAVGQDGAVDAVDARTLPEDPDALAEVLAAYSVFGRVAPHQKRAIIGALQRRGHVVAMTGDGVNDVLALKDADIGVAMGNGSPATRAVAQLVLLDGRFARLPDVVAEGRRVMANIERVACLFLVKNVYALLLALVAALTFSAYPLAPIQVSLIASVTIGVPGFFLALGANRRRYAPGLLRRVLRFAIPTGLVTGVSAYAGYLLTRALDSTAGVVGGRTTAALVVLVVSLWTLMVQARPLAGWKVLLVASMAAIVGLVVVLPWSDEIFLLHFTTLRIAVGVICGAVGALFVEAGARAVRARGNGRYVSRAGA